MTKIINLCLHLAISKIVLDFMRRRQTEKDIAEVNQSVGEPTKRKVGNWNFATKF